MHGYTPWKSNNPNRQNKFKSRLESNWETKREEKKNAPWFVGLAGYNVSILFLVSLLLDCGLTLVASCFLLACVA